MRKFVGDIRSLVNARGLQLQRMKGCMRSCSSLSFLWQRLIWRERDLLGIRRMDIVPNSQVRELYVVTKEVDERIDKSVL